MIISTNSEPKLCEFDDLLRRTTYSLNNDARVNESYYVSREGRKLEIDVCERMIELAKGTPFEDTIDLVSGQRFPDIVANKFFGVEVKSTTQNHWKTTGNSVLESTRVEGVERIFLLFGKLARPIEFRYRPYEECLSEVVVTHYPRYLIDMMLGEGETIFDKISMSYDELRKLENPIKPIISYYRSQLKEGEELWWIDTSDGSEVPTNSIKIRLWNTLSPDEKNYIRTKAIVLFPEIFGGSPKKYNNLSLWLVSQFGVASPSLRDTFTAGGRCDIVIGDRVYKYVPKIYEHVVNFSNDIKEMLVTTDVSELKRRWGVKDLCEDKKISAWVDLVSYLSVHKADGYDTRPLLCQLFGV